MISGPRVPCGCGCGQTTNPGCRYVYQHHKIKPAAVRFWSKVRKTETCWLWTGGIFQSGYGQFNLNGQTMNASRAAWIMERGAIADGLVICHRCDVRLCVNPAHLFLGTNKDNSEDMVAKGRQTKGEQHHRAKLTDSNIMAIRRAFESGAAVSDLAAEYRVCINNVRMIVSRQTWRHLP